MKQPSDKDIKKEKQSELDKIADINAKCVAGYQTIRKTVYNNISGGDLVKMNKYVYTEYGKVYTGLKGMIIDALNDAKDKNVKLVEKLLDESLPPAKHYEVLPKTAPFKYTNRVFTEKSVSVRSQKAADTITKIIADGRNDGLAIKDIQKKIDIVMGFRDAQGRYTNKSKALIEAGKFTHRNGSIYETYRIARTEVMRMNAFAKYDQFEELKKKYPNARLKLIATIDGRERLQSKEMNGQISNTEGEFLYPNAKYYRLGTAPAQWCINDRETCTIVFLTDKEAKENREELKELKEELKQDNQEQQEQKQEENNIIKNTITEAKEYANRFVQGGNATFDNAITLENLNQFNEQMTYLTEKYDFSEYKTVGSFTARRKKKPAAHANGTLIEIEKSFGAKTDKDFVDLFNNNVINYQNNINNAINEWKQYIGNPKYDQRKIIKQIKEWEQSAKYIRHNAFSSAENSFRDVVNHEFGHSLMFRAIDREIKAGGTYIAYGNTSKYIISQSATKTYKIVTETLREARKTGDIYKISKYADTDIHEFFAECYAIYERGVEKLPNYVNNMIKEVLSI